MDSIKNLLFSHCGFDVTLVIGEFLPFEQVFEWFAPDRTQSMISRFTSLTALERFDFHYHLLENPIYQAVIPNDVRLFNRALSEGSISRLNQFQGAHALPYIRHLNVPLPSLQWLAAQKASVCQGEVVRHLLRATTEAQCATLRPLLRRRIPLRHLANGWCEPFALQWLLSTPSMLSIPSNMVIHLDDKPDEIVKIWMEKSPISYRNYRHKRLIDMLQSPAVLELCFQRLYDFRFTERAISMAIQDNNLDVLRWWEVKEGEECLAMRRPTEVFSCTPISPSVRNWAFAHGIRVQ